MPVITPIRPGHEVHDLLLEVMEGYHPELLEAEVTVGLMFVSASEGSEPVLKLHSYPATAIVRITSYEQRVQGLPDATIKIDEVVWEGLKAEERLAVLDHELNHLCLDHDKDGVLKSDDAGRPKLKMRLHDLVVGGFSTIIARHGRHSLDAQHVHAVNEILRQRHFAWTDDMAEQDAPPDVVEFAGKTERRA